MTEQSTNVADWWATEIIDMQPGRIAMRGQLIQDLIGRLSFPEMIWLMTMGKKPTRGQGALLEAAMVAAVDHGPQAPSIATARMAVTCGLSLNNAMASAVNLLGDIHGGAGEQAVELYYDIDKRMADGREIITATEDAIADWQASRGKYIPGFGHRFHKNGDPRAPRLMELVERARTAGDVNGQFLDIGTAVEHVLGAKRNRTVPMNIDGATAVIFAELGCPPPLARGLFCLSRSVGILAHAWEQTQQGGRNKGPTPPHYRWTYTGPTDSENE